VLHTPLMNTANIELLRNRAIARKTDAQAASERVIFYRRAHAEPERIARLTTELAAAEGAAAGALFALREAEHDQAVTS